MPWAPARSDLNTLRADDDLIWGWAMGAKAEVEARSVAAMTIFMVVFCYWL